MRARVLNSGISCPSHQRKERWNSHWESYGMHLGCSAPRNRLIWFRFFPSVCVDPKSMGAALEEPPQAHGTSPQRIVRCPSFSITRQENRHDGVTSDISWSGSPSDTLKQTPGLLQARAPWSSFLSKSVQLTGGTGRWTFYIDFQQYPMRIYMRSFYRLLLFCSWRFFSLTFFLGAGVFRA